MYIKLHKSYRTVVAVCDTDLIGKKFEEGRRQLDVRENFYKGDEIDSEKSIELMQNYANEDATFNIVGKESVSTALKAGIINQSSVTKISGVPFALTLL